MNILTHQEQEEKQTNNAQKDVTNSIKLRVPLSFFDH